MKTTAQKTFNAGKWVEKPRRSEIVLCTCGNKYIKTRPGQTTCVKCIFAFSKVGSKMSVVK